ncbi:MAG: FMN-binding protein [Clostridia bacterium]|nr:FMN-binding protein [Clostridia bacterium]
MDRKNESASTLDCLRICGVLCAICAAVALLLATVNFITEDKIEKNTEIRKMDSISRIFSVEGVLCTPKALPDGHERINEIFSVSSEGNLLGYCVGVSSNGFGGEMELFVGFDTEGKIKGVDIVSHGETPGLGSKIGNEKFLGQFEGMDKIPTEGQNFEIVSGATKSSRAVAAAVTDAYNAIGKILPGGAGA